MKQITKKLLAIMEDVTHLQKDSVNKNQGWTYVSEAHAVDAIRRSMIKHGVVSIPSVQSHEIAPAGTTSKGTQMHLTTIVVEYMWVDTESGESITAKALGQGIAPDDKGAYKAATGANKYMLMKLFQLPTGDDPDEFAPKDEPSRSPQEQRMEKYNEERDQIIPQIGEAVKRVGHAELVRLAGELALKNPELHHKDNKITGHLKPYLSALEAIVTLQAFDVPTLVDNLLKYEKRLTDLGLYKLAKHRDNARIKVMGFPTLDAAMPTAMLIIYGAYMKIKEESHKGRDAA